jgi:hypothetical protein
MHRLDQIGHTDGGVANQPAEAAQVRSVNRRAFDGEQQSVIRITTREVTFDALDCQPEDVDEFRPVSARPNVRAP